MDGSHREMGLLCPGRKPLSQGLGNMGRTRSRGQTGWASRRLRRGPRLACGNPKDSLTPQLWVLGPLLIIHPALKRGRKVGEGGEQETGCSPQRPQYYLQKLHNLPSHTAFPKAPAA